MEWFQDEGRVYFRLTLQFLKATRDPYVDNHIIPTRIFLLDARLTMYGVGPYSYLAWHCYPTQLIYFELRPDNQRRFPASR
jgi:hypothetical protein